ncbi:MAG: redox-regulated ATPase YchF [Candidatus Paceibacterota bacterium]
MEFSVGIVGLPNVGKSTLFSLITHQEVNIQNYPFTTIDPNIAIVSVKDERLEKLSQLKNFQKVTFAKIEFIDIAGLVKGAHLGEGLGNQFLSQIRETKIILIVVRCFTDENVSHIYNTVDPERDIDLVNLELIYKDLETIEKRKKKIEPEIKAKKKEALLELNFLNQLQNLLEQQKLLFSVLEENVLEEPVISSLNLLTAKPQIYFLNGKEEEIKDTVKEKILNLKADYFIGNLKESPGLSPLIKKAYQRLNLITFFTIEGENEARAWPIKKGTSLIEAASMIHSDFKEKFIKGEVINWEKLLEIGDWHKAREKGLLRVEGKDYLVQDGDVLVIKHH